MRGIGEVVLLLGLVLGLVGLAVNSFVLTEDFGLSPIVAYLLLCTGPLLMAVLPLVALFALGAWLPLLVNWGSLALTALGGVLVKRRRF
jgi:hypothetical protein